MFLIMFVNIKSAVLRLKSGGIFNDIPVEFWKALICEICQNFEVLKVNCWNMASDSLQAVQDWTGLLWCQSSNNEKVALIWYLIKQEVNSDNSKTNETIKKFLPKPHKWQLHKLRKVLQTDRKVPWNKSLCV